MTTGCSSAWTQAARDVLAERVRQIEVEGWSNEHDDRHVRGELAAAAACYAAPSRLLYSAVEILWPVTWDRVWWKPSRAIDGLAGRRRDLVKAGALILAEIERIDRYRHGKDRGDADPR